LAVELALESLLEGTGYDAVDNLSFGYILFRYISDVPGTHLCVITGRGKAYQQRYHFESALVVLLLP
jgi:hypothetical protein